MSTRDGLPDWARRMDPPPDWASGGLVAEWEDRGLRMEARWWGAEGEPATEGPREVLITITDAAPANVKHRGVTSGAMRFLEGKLTELVRTFHESERRGLSTRHDVARRAVEGLASAMPPNPRAGGDQYYSQLLVMYAMLDNMGYEQPTKLMSEVLDTPIGTIRSQLSQARARQAGRSDG